MSQSSRLCSHCGVEVRPEGQADICWNCRGSLRPGEESSSLRRSWLDRMPGWDMPGHWLTLVIINIVIGVLSLSKLFVSLYAFPLWIVFVIPSLVSTRYILKNLDSRGAAQPSLPIFARLQLFSIMACYFFLPMIGDGGQYEVFSGALRPTGETVELSFYLSGLTAIIFFICTGAIFVAYFRNLPPMPARKPGKPARLGRPSL